MTPEEKQLLMEVNERLKKVESYTTNLGGSLEFRRLVSRYILGESGELEIGGTLKHTGTKAGFYGKSAVGQQAKINDPTGGGTQDAEARTAINSIIDVLEALGFSSSV